MRLEPEAFKIAHGGARHPHAAVRQIRRRGCDWPERRYAVRVPDLVSHARERGMVLYPPRNRCVVPSRIVGGDGLDLEFLPRRRTVALFQRHEHVERVHAVRHARRVVREAAQLSTVRLEVERLRGDVNADNGVRRSRETAGRHRHRREVRGGRRLRGRRGRVERRRRSGVVEAAYGLREVAQLAADRVRARDVAHLLGRQHLVARDDVGVSHGESALGCRVSSNVIHLRGYGLRLPVGGHVERKAAAGHGRGAAARIADRPLLAEHEPRHHPPRPLDGDVLHAIGAAPLAFHSRCDGPSEHGRAIVNDLHRVARHKHSDGQARQRQRVRAVGGEDDARARAREERRLGAITNARERERLSRARRDVHILGWSHPSGASALMLFCRFTAASTSRLTFARSLLSPLSVVASVASVPCS